MSAPTEGILSILYRYYKREALTAAEQDQLQQWLAESEHNQLLFDDLSNEQEWNRQLQALNDVDGTATWERLQERLHPKRQAVMYRLSITWAAAILGALLLGVAYYLWWSNAGSTTAPAKLADKAPTQAPLLPGHIDSVVTIQLEDGRVVPWQNDTTTALHDGGTEVGAGSMERLSYNTKSPSANLGWHTLRVPIGRQFQVVLADGSKVHLNAASRLRYPVAFTHAERSVWLEGEAYFEVKADSQHPFVVHSARGAITVTGTRFMVSDYASDPVMLAALEEGRVLLKAGGSDKQIQPGEVWQVAKDEPPRLGVYTLDEALSWRTHAIWFTNATYADIFRVLQRWYDIEVRIDQPITARFSGVLPTDRPLDSLLEILKKGRPVSFVVEGRVVHVRS